jgi:hypothetical protein
MVYAFSGRIKPSITSLPKNVWRPASKCLERFLEIIYKHRNTPAAGVIFI